MKANLIHIQDGKANYLFNNIDRIDAKKLKDIYSQNIKYGKGVLCVVSIIPKLN